jgi:uncharacterized protein YjiS (DUF1127 family)
MIRTSIPIAPAMTGPGRRTSALRETLSKTWQGLRDGVRTWRSYQRLTAMSNAELARRGITREDILRVAMFGEPGSDR